MAFGCFRKASRALAAVSHALADDYAVTSALLAEAAALGRNALADRDYLPSAAARQAERITTMEFAAWFPILLDGMGGWAPATGPHTV